ncbi:MAG TPA: methylmalonyl Co-A mutase-associated GTPase MeaB [Thermotogota bacterium]|nr:MAG: putative GTPase [Thermotogota bacterium ADurb.Bin062]HNW46939.1 methylmalonyl Co-A mutase-associated GTPase MeaB [Thermotogota bacterium]HNY82617.1 methylmalonyl Co-A mutase-associated GTPase MeaB [Thermotogota bacterium]HOD91668.1 methylmalonyl Co-A mutase-associated GTPase MeaB [Thermotogota bacterium]HOF24234.1 methylmalonyl Co-A mutase-associated GTPase MeaB [Thermotogota bacterium]
MHKRIENFSSDHPVEKSGERKGSNPSLMSERGMPKTASSLPEWHEEDKADRFATRVVSGAVGSVTPENSPSGTLSLGSAKTRKRRKLTLEDYLEGFEKRDKTVFARAITLIESRADADRDLSQELIQHLLPKSGESIRLGFTGIPGAGKSTLIDTLGFYLCEQGHHIAVLAIDPSSRLSGGSILGDKTRMEKLVGHPNAFIRPSPSGGVLGGVAQKSRETILLCEAFGYDVIVVETVGVGQSETTVHSMVDCFILLMIAGAGDELQGIKKGIVELADIIVVNKADGENLLRAKAFEREMRNVLHVISPASHGWKVPTALCSALSGEGVQELWEDVLRYIAMRKEQGAFLKNRQQQSLEWLHTLIGEYLRRRFYEQPAIQEALIALTKDMAEGRATPASALQALIALYEHES